MLRTPLLAVLLTALIAACSGRGTSHTGRAPASPGVVPDAGIPDFVSILNAAKDAVARGETAIDLDGDGRPEYTRVFSDGGVLVREEIDVDGDGTPDLVWDYSGTPETFTRIAHGQTVERVEVTLDPLTPDKASFVLTATPLDPSLPFTRVSYVVDPAAPAIGVTHELSTQRDGNYDVGFTSQTTLVQPDLDTIPTSGPGACTPDQAKSLQDAFNDMVTDALPCLWNLDRALFEMVGRMLANSNVLLTCDPDPSATCADIDSRTGVRPWRTGQVRPDMPITFHPNAFTSLGCGPLASTLFHEVLHYVLGLHLIGDGTGDPADRVYGCETTCYGEASRQTCAACLSSTPSDTSCAGYPDQPCTVRVCTCGGSQGTLYADADSCFSACGGTLGCFGSARCQPRGPCQ